MSSHDTSGKIPPSYNKVEVGAKRESGDFEGDSDVSQKRVKMRDLQSVLQSEGIDTHDPETSKLKESEEHMDIIETQGSQVVDKNAGEYADARHTEEAAKKTSEGQSDYSGSKTLDLNSEMCTDENDAVICLGGPGKLTSYEKGKDGFEHNHKPSGGSRLEFNAEDVASSANHDPFNFRSQNNIKSRHTLECGKATGRSEEKDALRKWKEMKKNGFMSLSYGGIPAAPKQRGRKSKTEALKQKMEQAKKEQVDRFTKIAAPSGLLNGLNPGIINHVRNSKQVHSIIQALVRSEKRESRKQASEMKAPSIELTERNLDSKTNGCGVPGSSFSREIASFSSLPEGKLLRENHFSHNMSSLFSSGDRGRHGISASEDGTSYNQTSLASHPKNYRENDILALNLASSAMACESTSCLSNEESENANSVDTLSFKAATVASQWLHLLQQDIKERLAALRRSKKRVRAVITTELPSLLSKEFSSDQDNAPCSTMDPTTGCSNKAAAELHQAQWGKLFNQMDTSLSEEEKQLECWLKEVDQMLVLCDQGLQHVHWNKLFDMQRLGALDNSFRSKIVDPEKDLSVRAAAASIYSTGNFISSRDNVSCF